MSDRSHNSLTTISISKNYYQRLPQLQKTHKTQKTSTGGFIIDLGQPK